jgi:hypothetical protein
MRYKCNVCYINHPCILELRSIGDVPPTECPFKTDVMAKACWKLQAEKGKCKWCGDVLKHSDDSISECRFCNASPRNPDGSPKTDFGDEAQTQCT